MYTVLASRRARYDFVVVEKHLCLICALYWILQQGSQSDCSPLLSTGQAIGSIAPWIDPTFQKIWMCSMPNEFSRTAVIWTYLYFNRSELKITEAKCLIILTGNEMVSHSSQTHWTFAFKQERNGLSVSGEFNLLSLKILSDSKSQKRTPFEILSVGTLNF